MMSGTSIDGNNKSNNNNSGSDSDQSQFSAITKRGSLDPMLGTSVAEMRANWMEAHRIQYIPPIFSTSDLKYVYAPLMALQPEFRWAFVIQIKNVFALARRKRKHKSS